MQGFVVGSKLLQTSQCCSVGRLAGPLRQMSMRTISRELAAEDDSHVWLRFILCCIQLFGKSKLSPRVVLQLYRMNRAKAGSIRLDQDLRIHDDAEMSRPRRKNPLVTLGNVAMVAAAAGIATALCREVQVHRSPHLAPHMSMASPRHCLSVDSDLALKTMKLSERCANVKLTSQNPPRSAWKSVALSQPDSHLISLCTDMLGSVVTTYPFRRKERSGRSHNPGLHQLAKTCSTQRSLIHSR